MSSKCKTTKLRYLFPDLGIEELTKHLFEIMKELGFIYAS